MKTVDIAIIGAGLSGCIAANQLPSSKFTRMIIEKSRGVGGRCSRRQTKEGMNIDLGLPSFSEKQTHLLNTIFKQKGILPWQYKQYTENDGVKLNNQWVAAPSMNQVHRELIQDVPLLRSTRVQRITESNQQFILYDEVDQAIVKATQVIVTAPAIQTQALLSTLNIHDAQIEHAAEGSYPQFIIVLNLLNEVMPYSVYCGQHPVIEKIIAEHHKPERENAQGATYTIHTTPTWSKQFQDMDIKEVSIQVKEAFENLFSCKGQATCISSHRWLLAGHEIKSQKNAYLSFLDNRVHVCADWLVDDNITGAIKSSTQLVESIKAL